MYSVQYLISMFLNQKSCSIIKILQQSISFTQQITFRYFLFSGNETKKWQNNMLSIKIYKHWLNIKQFFSKIGHQKHYIIPVQQFHCKFRTKPLSLIPSYSPSTSSLLFSHGDQNKMAHTQYALNTWWYISKHLL